MTNQIKHLTKRQDFIESAARWLVDFHPSPLQYESRFYITHSVIAVSRGNAQRLRYLERVFDNDPTLVRFYNAVARRAAELVAAKGSS